MISDARARRTGALLLGAAALYLVALGTLRERFGGSAVAWAAGLVALLAAGAALWAWGYAGAAPARARRAGQLLLLGGSVGLGLGVVGTSDGAAGWAADTRAAAALAFVTAFGALAAGAAFARRASRMGAAARPTSGPHSGSRA